MQEFQFQFVSSAEDRSVEILSETDELVTVLKISDAGRVDFRFLAGLEKDVTVPLSVVLEAVALAVERSDTRYDDSSTEEDLRPSSRRQTK